MPRIRTLKPEILEDEKTSRLSDSAYRLFTSMIVLADDHGNVRADAAWLRAQVWWAHASPPNVVALLVELWRGGLIDVYAVRGGTYATLLGWDKHQRVDNAGKGRVPSPNDKDARAVDDNLAPCGSPPQSAATRGEMRLDPEGDQEKEREREPAAKSPRSSPSRLSQAWAPRVSEQRLAETLGLDCAQEAGKFRDYHVAKGSTMVDWNAAFRGWLRKGKQFNGVEPKQEQERTIPEL